MNELGTLKYIDRKVTVHNNRELKLVYAFNIECDAYLADCAGVGKGAGKDLNNWMLQEVAGLARAMFFLDMIAQPLTDVEIMQTLGKELRKAS